MDPNATLAALIEDAEAIQRERDGFSPDFNLENATDFLYRMAENIEALNGWMKSGGFKPSAWE